MRRALVGVVGHVDHGKTALVRALTGSETDRLKEEKARGLSIVLGFAVLKRAGVEVDLVDMPGHERFVRAMISGATGIDAVLLAVDAGEGVKPQTVEHLDIAALVGVRRGVIAVTKCDAAAAADVAAAGEAARALFDRRGIEALAVAETSAVSGHGIDLLAGALASLAAEPGEPDPGAPFFLPIDRSFTAKGFGSVVTGTLRGGALAVGQEVEIVPSGRRAELRGLQIHGQAAERAPPGCRVAANLRGVDLEALPLGHALAAPGALVPARWLDVSLAVPPDGAPLQGGALLSLLSGTAEMPARLRLLDRDEVAPGERAVAQLRLARELAVPAGEPFILRLPSPARTVAGGRILDPASRRRKRGDRVAIDALTALAAGDVRQALLLRLGRAGGRGIAVADAARLAGTGQDTLRGRLAEWGVPVAAEIALHPETWARLASEAADAVRRFGEAHPLEDGMPAAALPSALPDAPPEVARAVAEGLLAKGVLVRRGGALRPDTSRPRRERDQRLLQAVEGAFREAGLTPPDEAAAVAGDARRGEAVRHLLREGVLVRTTDRVQKRTIVFHRDAVAQAKAVLTTHLAGTDFPAREAGAALGVSRKFSIPLLEHLDAVGFTRREGDRRRIVGEKAGEDAA
ncbi:selenocysteine-specific translation elongation factor [Lutibaculum baratangense]|uniref:Selenocysteine-specific translation elongation factor n=1 Tax=Lutibaculum baratangense AMV1 TaxID=631454 RepID=V4TDA2_9HYPH|nr:selenocysteine-specific translation elongation factor [Lutibaculum baratangense]ESR24268.1 Selenocysteine-specific translation elongation factor [Lutibaculum baratangense AMV1]